MLNFFRKFEKTPLTKEEWKGIKCYQRLSPAERLKALDNYRSFMFRVWKQNPSLYKEHLKNRV